MVSINGPNWGESERAPPGQFNESFVCLSVCLFRTFTLNWHYFGKLNATHARSVQHHVQFFPTVKRFVVESSYFIDLNFSKTKQYLFSGGSRSDCWERDLHLSCLMEVSK